GKDLESRGGRFAAIAIEDDDDGAKKAREFMISIGVPPASALRLSALPDPATLDPRLGFTGSQLPFTALISPSGQVVWKYESQLDEAKLKAILTEHTGFAAR